MKLSTIQKIKDPATRARLLSKYAQDRRVEQVRTQVLSCEACSLRSHARKPVPWSGPVPSRLVFVGEGPGAEEDRFGTPFVGKSGQLFDHLLNQAGLDREEVFVTNVVCCRPPENRDPLPTEISACQPNLDAQLDLAGSWVGVTLGSYAIAAVTGRTRSQVKITAERGEPVVMGGRVWIPTFHPAYALRNPQAGKHIIDDIRAAIRLVEGEESLPPKDYELLLSWDGGDLLQMIGEKGYAVVRLRRVRDVVVVVRDETVEVPESMNGRAIYTLEELVKLGEYGRAAKFNDADYLHLHLAKKILGATVVA